MASRAPNGSSMSRIEAFWAMARARATRWRMPPDSSWGRLPPKPLSRTMRSSSLARSSRSALGTPARRSARLTLPRTDSQGNSADSWNMSDVRPDTVTVPAAGVSRPASRLSSVLLPQPEAPTRQQNSPGTTSREMRSRAKVWLPRGP